jgi:drug/metabolite transporter (DMT)-like permease
MGVEHMSLAPLRARQVAGLASGVAAGAWLGAAEAPTKLVTIGLAPVVVSFAMVLGVFLGRWSLPALLHGTAAVRDEARRLPHLIVWAVLAGALWSVANTLTVYAIRDVGLSIAFPLWNANSLLGILWGAVFFHELRGGGTRTVLLVVGGAIAMLVGGTVLALASATDSASPHAVRGIAAALAAGAMWGTMYIPYRKAYLTGMSPLAFVTFFTIGELVSMSGLALWLMGGVQPLRAALVDATPVLFFLFAGGVVWVIGDLFQQYAAKYIGISRGIPLSNTNQLWGLAWGLLVFGELPQPAARVAVVTGAVIMALGAAAIAFATPNTAEYESARAIAQRESARYGLDAAWVDAQLTGSAAPPAAQRGALDWLIAGAACAVLAWAAAQAQRPTLAVAAPSAALISAVALGLLAFGALAVRRANAP